MILRMSARSYLLLESGGFRLVGAMAAESVHARLGIKADGENTAQGGAELKRQLASMALHN